MNKYLAFDLELGGIGLDKSLLTAYFCILDENYSKVDDLYLECKPNDGIYIVEGKGLQKNGINLAVHDLTAITYKEAGTKLYDFLRSGFDGSRFRALGHGVYGDINHICNKLISEGSWDKYVDYAVLDTGAIATLAMDLGLTDRTGVGLDSLAKFFEVGVQNEVHDAKSDTWLAINLYLRLREIFKQ